MPSRFESSKSFLKMCELEYVVKFHGIGDLDWSKVELRRHIFSAPESWEGRRTEADAVYDLESPLSVIFDVSFQVHNSRISTV
jgi:hypothetical protein